MGGREEREGGKDAGGGEVERGGGYFEEVGVTGFVEVDVGV